MLTYKIVMPDSESVGECKYAHLSNLNPEARQCVEISLADELPRLRIFEGRIYIMNENGATISKYDLGYGHKIFSQDKASQPPPNPPPQYGVSVPRSRSRSDKLQS